MAISKTERRDQSRRITDRNSDDLYKTFSTPHCHSCLERMAEAVLLLDDARRTMYATSQVDQLIRRLSLPLALTPKFNLPDPNTMSRLISFMSEKTPETGPLSLLLAGEQGRDMLLLTCFRLPAPSTSDLDLDLHTARYLVVLRDPNHYPARQWHLFAEQFSLTQAETRICRALADGLTLGDYCAKWRVTMHTARSQLKGIFAKTSTGRQSDLLRLIYLFMRA